MTKLMYDNETPIAKPPATDAVLIYVGGDTPHAWTDAEIAAQPARYRLPCWVRSNPNPTLGASEANTFAAWLKARGVPRGVATVLDLEEAVSPAYVEAFAAVMHQEGYLVLPYGSAGYLFKNPQIDGYFVAAPGARAMDARCVATQFDYLGGYDLSWVADSVPLWDTQPPAPAPPTPAPAAPAVSTVVNEWTDPQEGTMQTLSVPVPVANGYGWTPTTIPWASLAGEPYLNGSDPVADGYYLEGEVETQDRGNCVFLTVTGCKEVSNADTTKSTLFSGTVTVFVVTHS